MVSKPKVLYVADTFPPIKDGVVRFMIETYKRLSGSFDISFLVPAIHGSKTAARTMNIKANFVPIRKFKINTYPVAYPKSKTIKEEVKKADLIFINSIGPLGAATLKKAKKQNKPTVEYIHSIDWLLFSYATKFPNKRANLLKRIVLRLYNKNNLLIVANKELKYFLKSSKIKSEIKTVPLGVNTNKFKPDRIRRMYARKELNLKKDFVIGFHGRLSKEKNISMLVKTFKKVQKKIPFSKLLIMGDGKERNKVENKKDIISLGFVENPEDYLQAVDVYVLPSMTETTGLSLMEAMACGLPCIATNVGAIPNYLEDNKNGILINSKTLSSDIIFREISKLHKEVWLRNKIAKKAAKTIKEHYTWGITSKKLKKIFEELTK